jgi:3-hydroxyisobutyrate dehydrogenase-like beta-hydroxyacid dehydrogenase
MATHLVDWPGGLVVHDVRDEAAAPFAEKGARVASTVRQVAEEAEIISVMVRDDAEVRVVVEEILGVGKPRSVVAIHSTIRPGTAEALSADAEPRGVAIVDAPVSGGPIGAAQGTLAVLAGGDPAAIERCLEPFGRWASLIEHFGPVGAGTRAKLARNLITFVGYSAAGEAQRLAEAAGVDLRRLANVVRHSDGVTGGPGAIMLRASTAPLAPDDPLFEILSHTRDLGEKDLALALELAERLGVELPFAALALKRFGAGLGLQ